MNAVLLPDVRGPQLPGPRLHTYELTIWEKAEHWRFYETVRAVDEQAVRKEFVQRYGRGYRLEQVHWVC